MLRRVAMLAIIALLLLSSVSCSSYEMLEASREGTYVNLERGDRIRVYLVDGERQLCYVERVSDDLLVCTQCEVEFRDIEKVERLQRDMRKTLEVLGVVAGLIGIIVLAAATSPMDWGSWH